MAKINVLVAGAVVGGVSPEVLAEDIFRSLLQPTTTRYVVVPDEGTEALGEVQSVRVSAKLYSGVWGCTLTLRSERAAVCHAHVLCGSTNTSMPSLLALVEMLCLKASEAGLSVAPESVEFRVFCSSTEGAGSYRVWGFCDVTVIGASAGRKKAQGVHVQPCDGLKEHPEVFTHSEEFEDPCEDEDADEADCEDEEEEDGY